MLWRQLAAFIRRQMVVHFFFGSLGMNLVRQASCYATINTFYYVVKVCSRCVVFYGRKKTN